MSSAATSPSLPTKALAVGGPDALVTREVDDLVGKLLGEIQIPFGSMGKRALNNLADLKRVLAADYLEDANLPKPELLRELKKFIDSDVTSNDGRWKSMDSPELLQSLFKKFGPREIELRAEPYKAGAGLALRGFFCRTNVGPRNKFVIFVNTAHHPAAVAATLGHELGHYIYGTLVGEKRPMTAFMEGTFASHLKEDDELFADCFVALAAYSKSLMIDIGAVRQPSSGESEELFARIRKAYGLLKPRFKINLSEGRMQAAWRVRYLTSMTHFFKLRSAIHELAEI